MPHELPPEHPQYATQMVNDCLSAGVTRRASDVHWQPRSQQWDVSLRIDGVLQAFRSYKRSDASDPVSRLMAMANLPAYRLGIPQEGSLQWQPETGVPREMRLGIFPTVHGNRAAVRIMDSRESIRQLDRLGFDPDTTANLKSVCDSREGWLLVAGPAGSGKTTTLYACLSHIALGHDRRSVLTIEDPIESVIDSICQSQLQPNTMSTASGLTLASALRAAVRQDAEVLLVSEIRDVETAEAVLAASMTGHLCFSSIHASSIGGTLRRLVNMDLPIFAIRSGLRGILCQRLLRRTCPACGGESKHDGGPTCDQCHCSGYDGRIPIAQLISFSADDFEESLFDALSANRTASEIDQIIDDGGIESLRLQANRLIEQRQTDAAEVIRVLGIHAVAGDRSINAELA